MSRRLLSAAQLELLAAMRDNGVRVHFMAGLDAYAFRTDTHRRCTVVIEGLRKRGLVEPVNATWRGCEYQIVKKGGAK